MKWVSCILILLVILGLVGGCTETQNTNDAYQAGYNAGYRDGEQLGYYRGFRDGCREGYSEGIIYWSVEKPLGIEPNMDWFYSRYPQYR